MGIINTQADTHTHNTVRPPLSQKVHACIMNQILISNTNTNLYNIETNPTQHLADLPIVHGGD